MAFQEVLKFLVSSWVLFFLILACAPCLLYVKPASFIVNPCPAFKNALEPNNVLDGVTKLFENKIEGPESITVYKDKLYTGLADGRIIRIHGDQIQTVAQIGNPRCEGRWDEDICGRPLGMRFDANGFLYVLDAYYGLYKINVDTGAVAELYNIKTIVDKRESHLLNDLDISKSGVVYFSDSGKWNLKYLMIEVLESAPNGRILKYDPNTKKTEILVQGISFANGVQLSPDEDYLLICETSYRRIMKYHLKGKNVGKLEILVENLPGSPDNIRLTPRGTFWIAQCTTRTPGHFDLLGMLSNRPIIRRMAACFLLFLRFFVGLMNFIYAPPTIKMLQYKITHLYEYAKRTAPNYGLILEIDNKGNIIRSLHSPAGAVHFVSEVLECGNSLYLGSPWHNFLATVKLVS